MKTKIKKWHILPTNDLREHKESEFCKCKPTIDVQENGNVIFIHNSFDGREAIEMANKIIDTNHPICKHKDYTWNNDAGCNVCDYCNKKVI